MTLRDRRRGCPTLDSPDRFWILEQGSWTRARPVRSTLGEWRWQSLGRRAYPNNMTLQVHSIKWKDIKSLIDKQIVRRIDIFCAAEGDVPG